MQKPRSCHFGETILQTEIRKGKLGCEQSKRKLPTRPSREALKRCSGAHLSLPPSLCQVIVSQFKRTSPRGSQEIRRCLQETFKMPQRRSRESIQKWGLVSHCPVTAQWKVKQQITSAGDGNHCSESSERLEIGGHRHRLAGATDLRVCRGPLRPPLRKRTKCRIQYDQYSEPRLPPAPSGNFEIDVEINSTGSLGRTL